MLKTIGNIIYDYYQFLILPFLSISIFYAMEYMSRGVEFFVDEKGVKWRFLSFCALMQFFVSLVVILSVSAMFKSDALQEYQTLQLVAIILLGTTPFNISILIWIAIKLEIYRLMRNRYEKEFKEMIHTDSLLQEALTGKPQSTQQENKLKELAQPHTTQTEVSKAKPTQDESIKQTKNNKTNIKDQALQQHQQTQSTANKTITQITQEINPNTQTQHTTIQETINKTQANKENDFLQHTLNKEKDI